MGTLSTILGYAATLMLVSIGYNSYKAYKEYKEDRKEK